MESTVRISSGFRQSNTGHIKRESIEENIPYSNDDLWGNGQMTLHKRIKKEAVETFNAICMEQRRQMNEAEKEACRDILDEIKGSTEYMLSTHSALPIYKMCVTTNAVDLDWVPWLAMRLLYMDCRDYSDPSRDKFRTCSMATFVLERFADTDVDIFRDTWPAVRPPRPQAWGVLCEIPYSQARNGRTIATDGIGRGNSHIAGRGRFRSANSQALKRRRDASNGPRPHGKQNRDEKSISTPDSGLRRSGRAKTRPNYTEIPGINLQFETQQPPIANTSDIATGFSRDTIENITSQGSLDTLPDVSISGGKNDGGLQHKLAPQMESWSDGGNKSLHQHNEMLQAKVNELEARLQGLNPSSKVSKRDNMTQTDKQTQENIQLPGQGSTRTEGVFYRDFSVMGSNTRSRPEPMYATREDRISGMMNRRMDTRVRELYGEQVDMGSFVTKDNMSTVLRDHSLWLSNAPESPLWPILERLSRLEESHPTADQILDLLDPQPE